MAASLNKAGNRYFHIYGPIALLSGQVICVQTNKNDIRDVINWVSKMNTHALRNLSVNNRSAIPNLFTYGEAMDQTAAMPNPNTYGAVTEQIVKL